MSEVQGATVTFLNFESWQAVEAPRRVQMTVEMLATPLGAAFGEWNQANERAMREYERRQEAREAYDTYRFGSKSKGERRVA